MRFSGTTSQFVRLDGGPIIDRWGVSRKKDRSWVRPDSLSKIASRLDCQPEASVLSAGIFLRNEVSTEKAANLATWILAQSQAAAEVVLIGQT